MQFLRSYHFHKTVEVWASLKVQKGYMTVNIKHDKDFDVENIEIYDLNKCTLFTNERKLLYSECSKYVLDIYVMNHTVAFIHIMTSTEPSVILATAKYIFTCLTELRTQNSELFIWPYTFIFFYNNTIQYNSVQFMVVFGFFPFGQGESYKVKWDCYYGSHLLWVVAKMKNIINKIK